MKTLYSLLIFAACLIACSKKESPQEKFELEEISAQEADSLSIAITSIQDTSTNDALIHPTAAGKGDSERQWRLILKNVLENYTFRNPVYLGVSNRKNIGTVMDRRQEVERMLEEMVGEEAFKVFLTKSNSGPLEALNSKDFNINLLVNANAMGVDAAVASAIARSDSSRLVAGSWEIYDLVWGTLRDSIDGRSEVYKRYATDLNVKRNVVITKVAKVTSFKSEIFTSTDINAELKAKMDTSTAKINSVGGEMKFKVDSKRQFTASSTGYFYVFGILSKKKIESQ